MRKNSTSPAARYSYSIRSLCCQNLINPNQFHYFYSIIVGSVAKSSAHSARTIPCLCLHQPNRCEFVMDVMFIFCNAIPLLSETVQVILKSIQATTSFFFCFIFVWIFCGIFWVEYLVLSAKRIRYHRWRVTAMHVLFSSLIGT